jgi:hypothetical protein
MVTPMLRELAGPFRPFFLFDEPWFLYERNARHVTDAWDHVCRQAIQTGSAEELHAIRDDYQSILLAHLKILDGCLILLSRLQGEYPHERFAERLPLFRDALQKHYDALFPRWQTLDDLEAMLLERASLPNDQLKALAAKYPPPQAWYDETDAPPAAQE